MSQVKKENSSQDSTMTGATDFFSVPKELEINEKTLEKTAVVAEEKK